MPDVHQPIGQPLDQPSATLAGPGFPAAARRAFLATRPPFFTASVLPVLVGTAWASAAHHHVHGLLFALALAATVLAHAATNVYNDVSDDLIGTDPANVDRIYPYTGGSRFIQAGLLTRAEMSRLALGLAVGALLVGVLLALLRGPGVVLLGLMGLGLGLLYSMPGAQLSARGIGEAAVAIGLGMLPVVGAAWLQTGTVDSGILLISVPVSAWVAAILLINEVPDVSADRRAGKRTLVVRLGSGGARAIYLALTALALAASLAAILQHALPSWYALPALGFAALGCHCALGISTAPARRKRLKQSIEITLAVQALGNIALVIAMLVEHIA